MCTIHQKLHIGIRELEALAVATLVSVSRYWPARAQTFLNKVKTVPASGTFALHRRTRLAINVNSWVRPPLCRVHATVIKASLHSRFTLLSTGTDKVQKAGASSVQVIGVISG
jgi:hypothetical protein